MKELLDSTFFQIILAFSSILGGYAAYIQIFNLKNKRKSIKSIESLKMSLLHKEFSINGEEYPYKEIKYISIKRNYHDSKCYYGFFKFILNVSILDGKNNPIISWFIHKVIIFLLFVLVIFSSVFLYGCISDGNTCTYSNISKVIIKPLIGFLIISSFLLIFLYGVRLAFHVLIFLFGTFRFTGCLIIYNKTNEDLVIHSGMNYLYLRKIRRLLYRYKRRTWYKKTIIINLDMPFIKY